MVLVAVLRLVLLDLVLLLLLLMMMMMVVEGVDVVVCGWM